MIILYILIAILVFGFMILVHELGHFMFAKKFGVAISEFSIGMGPKLFSKKGKDGISYSLRLFPIGGYVAMIGESEDSDDPNAFNKKPAYQRFIITAAGALMNLLIGIIIMVILTASNGTYGTTTIGQFDEKAISNQYLMIGDEILKVENTRVHTSSELYYEIMRSGNKPISITVQRGGNELVLKNVEFPTSVSEGIVFGSADFLVYGEDRTLFTVVKHSYFSCKSTIKMIWDSLYDLLAGRYGIEQISGPIGVTGAISNAAQTSTYSLFYLIVVISLNLGIFNLLPIPALDGGSLLLLIIEMIIRKPIPQNVEYGIKAVGFIILMGFVIIVSFKDIIFLFK